MSKEGVDQDLLRWLIEQSRDNEWQFHRDDLRYCPYCCRSEDQLVSMTEHHPGCEYVAMMVRTVGLGG